MSTYHDQVIWSVLPGADCPESAPVFGVGSVTKLIGLAPTNARVVDNVILQERIIVALDTINKCLQQGDSGCNFL